MDYQGEGRIWHVLVLVTSVFGTVFGVCASWFNTYSLTLLKEEPLKYCTKNSEGYRKRDCPSFESKCPVLVPLREFIFDKRFIATM